MKLLKYPTSHRAGRWGIDQRTIDWLIERNFLVDTTIVPFKSFESSIGKFKPGPSFEKYNTNSILNYSIECFWAGASQLFIAASC